MSENTQIISWESELAKQALDAIANEPGTAERKFFSLKSGVLSWDSEPVVGNEIAVVIVGSLFENAYYADKYNADAVAPPVCYSLSKTGTNMVPHEGVIEKGTKVHDNCKDCPNNVFGSNGKGKLCKNTRRLALVSAGNFNRAGEFEFKPDFLAPTIGFLRVPVTSTKNFSDYVRKVAAMFKRPPFGVITKIKLVPDTKTMFKVTFDVIEPLPDEYLQDIMNCVALASENIEFPYNLEVAAVEKPTPSKRKY